MIEMWPEPKPGARVKITVPTLHYERFMTSGFTAEPDKGEWTNLLVVWRSDGQTDLYTIRQ
jgi:hypothetical protein